MAETEERGRTTTPAVTTEEIHVTGTLVWYYYVCHRQVWLMSRQVTPDEDHPSIDLGRFIHEYSYQRDRKELTFGHLKLDVLGVEHGQLVIGEVKKSSRHRQSARMRLLFYLDELRRRGVAAKGELRFPQEKRREKVIEKLLEFLSQKEVLLHYFSHYGYYMGTFYPREHMSSGYMILRQAETYLDEGRRLALARAFVEGAHKNMTQVLRYYARRGREVDEMVQGIEALASEVPACKTTEELMAIEGNMRNVYYGAFDAIVGDPAFAFEARSRRPPRNFMNTLISFGNSVIYVVTLSEIYKTHLDPRIGYLHATNFRRFTLNLDVSEVFKPIVVDRAIFSVIDRKQVSPQDFVTGTEGVMLTEKGRQVFVNELDSKLDTTIRHRSLGRDVSYRRLIRLELYKIEKHIMGEKPYEPFVARW